MTEEIAAQAYVVIAKLMNARILLTILLLVSGAASADVPDAAHRKMAFMCTWVAGHMPGTVALQPCDAAGMETASSADLTAAMGAYWQEWTALGNRSRVAAFEDDFEKAWSPPEPHRYTAAQTRGESTQQLCSHVRGGDTMAAMAIDELKRRNSLTPDELRLVRVHSIQIGISEIALKCSWGDPQHQNRAVTAGGASIQWIYGERTYVYTVKGVVTAYQD